MIHNRQLAMRRIPALLGDAKLSRMASHKDSRISPFSARGIKHVLNHSQYQGKNCVCTAVRTGTLQHCLYWQRGELYFEVFAKSAFLTKGKM